MTLDPDTLHALGYGDAWEQLALRWPLYVVASTRRDWRKGRTTTQSAPASTLTTAQRREASRLVGRGATAAAVARKLGVTPRVVRRYLAARAA